MSPRFFAVAVFTILGCSSCFLARPLHEKTVTLTVADVPGQALRVEASNGRIEVTNERSADVQITAVIRALSPERLEATTVLAERAANGELLMKAVWPE